MSEASTSDAVRLRAPRWDLFCRVVDHLGDAAIGWRLARQLAQEHGLQPRLWIDRPEVLAELVPGAVPGADVDGVTIEHWVDDDPRLAAPGPGSVADVVVSLLAGAPPDGYRVAMRVRRPVWVAYEYLSAEPWVESCHGLPSPKPDGLVEHFFFPGFEPGTGGLLREGDLPARIEVVKRRDAYETHYDRFMKTWASMDAGLRNQILAARAALPAIKTPGTALHDCAALCLALGSDGLRGELTLLRAGRALAAFEGASSLKRSHLRRVAPMALSHRLRRDPLDEAGSGARVGRTLAEVLP